MAAISTVAGPERHEQRGRADATASERYSIAIGYLRAFVTLLVVAHHAVLAYHQFAPPAPAALVAEPRWWPAFPVVDSERWPGFMLFVAFNDTFFMSLMFLLSGLFVSASLASKGGGTFLRGRAFRLGVPFVVSAAILAPLAYYPSYLTTTMTPSLADFRQQWGSLRMWPAGPAWFLWVLLAFDAAAAAVFLIRPSAIHVSRGLMLRIADQPWAAFGVLVVASALAYVPLAVLVTPFHWTLVGPFAVQTSRVLHYALYFGVGVALGGSVAERGLLAPEGPLARRWVAWGLMALASFAVMMPVAFIALSRPESSYLWGSLAAFAFVLSCAASCFGCLAVFLRFARRRHAAWDSVRVNAYGIYLVHYAVVTWLQYSLLGAGLTGLTKGALVFVGSAAISWGLVAALRRIPAVARVV